MSSNKLCMLNAESDRDFDKRGLPPQRAIFVYSSNTIVGTYIILFVEYYYHMRKNKAKF